MGGGGVGLVIRLSWQLGLKVNRGSNDRSPTPLLVLGLPVQELHVNSSLSLSTLPANNRPSVFSAACYIIKTLRPSCILYLDWSRHASPQTR